jgi:3-oxoacyl-(acyl-carrier-protein) synthase
MLRSCCLSVAVLFLVAGSAHATLAGGCDNVDGQSVRSFAATMTSAPGVHLFTGSPATAVQPASSLRKGPIVMPLGCSANDCRVCNDNGLTCQPVPGDCCCV